MHTRSYLIIALAMTAVVLTAHEKPQACDIAVISASASSNGRPFIWKNRDHDSDWRQEVRHKTEGTQNGVAAYIVIVDNTGLAEVPSGGVNDNGFAIANTTVYEQNIIHEYINTANHYLMEDALKQCITIEDFDNMLASWEADPANANRIISGNFVAIDAYGGAALYEGFSGAYGTGRLFVNKVDAETGIVTNKNGEIIGVNGTIYDYEYTYSEEVPNIYTVIDYEDLPFLSLQDYLDLMEYLFETADNAANFDPQQYVREVLSAEQVKELKQDDWPGFANRTNSHIWISRNSDTNREIRGDEILRQLQAEDRLTYENIMRQLARDLNKWDYENGLRVFRGQEQLSQSERETLQNNEKMIQVNTKYSINRYQTNLSLVVDGVAPGQDPRLATLWCNLGEPAVGIFIPTFPCSDNVSNYTKALETTPEIDENDPSCLLNRAINDKELTLYDNNAYEGFSGIIYSTVGGDADYKIDYPGLLGLQQWSLPLEKILVDKTEEYLADMEANAARVSSANLKNFANYCAAFAYANYCGASATAESWDFPKPWGGLWLGYGREDLNKPASSDPSAAAEEAKALGTWYLLEDDDSSCFIASAVR